MGITSRKTEQASEFERYKRTQEGKKRIRTIGSILLITLVAAGAVLAFGAFSGSPFGTEFRTRFISKEGEFPRPIYGGSVRQLEALGWDVGLLSDTEFAVYSTNGDETLRLTHGMAQPMLATAGSRGLLFDQSGKTFEVISPSRSLYSGTAAGGIHVADIAPDGSVAIASSAPQHATEVAVYDGSYHQIGSVWTSSSMVTAIALSPDAKQTAVACIGVRGGAALSSIYLLDVSNAREVFRIELPGEMVYNLSFQNNTIHVITDQSVKSLDLAGRVRARYAFNGQQPMLYADASGAGTVLVMGNYRYLRESTIVSLDDKCKVTAEVTVGETIDALRADSSGFTCLSEGAVTRYDFKGAVISRTPVTGAVTYLPLGQNLYAATYEELKKLDLR